MTGAVHDSVQSVGCTCAEPVELLDQLHGRSLLGKKGDPAKAKWEPKTNRKTAAVFVQAGPLGLIPSDLTRRISPPMHMLWYTGAAQHLAGAVIGKPTSSMLVHRYDPTAACRGAVAQADALCCSSSGLLVALLTGSSGRPCPSYLMHALQVELTSRVQRLEAD